MFSSISLFGYFLTHWVLVLSENCFPHPAAWRPPWSLQSLLHHSLPQWRCSRPRTCRWTLRRWLRDTKGTNCVSRQWQKKYPTNKPCAPRYLLETLVSWHVLNLHFPEDSCGVLSFFFFLSPISLFQCVFVWKVSRGVNTISCCFPPSLLEQRGEFGSCNGMTFSSSWMKFFVVQFLYFLFDFVLTFFLLCLTQTSHLFN